MVMTEPIEGLTEEIASLLQEQQDRLKEAAELIEDICLISRQLMEQGQADEAKIRQLQEQILRWKTLCSDLTGQNEALMKQNQELQRLKGPLMQEEGSVSGMNRSNRKENWQDMPRGELLEALAGKKQEIHVLYTQKISLRELSARLNEENAMLLALWEEAEQKYGNAKDAYEKLWSSYEQYKGLYETLKRRRGER